MAKANPGAPSAGLERKALAFQTGPLSLLPSCDLVLNPKEVGTGWWWADGEMACFYFLIFYFAAVILQLE